jgi:hypothetical protein
VVVAALSLLSSQLQQSLQVSLLLLAITAIPLQAPDCSKTIEKGRLLSRLFFAQMMVGPKLIRPLAYKIYPKVTLVRLRQMHD